MILGPISDPAVLFTAEAKEHQETILRELGTTQESTRIGLKLANFCRKAESFYAEASRLRPQSLGLYSGRAMGLKFRMVPHLVETTSDDVELLGGYDLKTRVWATQLVQEVGSGDCTATLGLLGFQHSCCPN